MTTAQPALDSDPAATREARDAVTRLVAELREVLDKHDAEIDALDDKLTQVVGWSSALAALRTPADEKGSVR